MCYYGRRFINRLCKCLLYVLLSVWKFFCLDVKEADGGAKGRMRVLVFSSTVFLFLFLPLTVLIYYNPVFTGRRFRNYFLLLASLGFYAYGEPIFVAVMIFAILLGWLAGWKIEKAGTQQDRKRWLVVGTSLLVAMLFVFKYLTFVCHEMGLLLHTDMGSISIALPIGISFFTFQLLSYLFDIYYGKAHAQKNLLNVGLYIALFPQLIAGPIVRYDTIEKQIMERRENIHDFAAGMERFIYGLGKKVLLANYMGQLADGIFGLDGDISTATAWLGAVAYTLQIYFDFSGYSDMAIGLGRMFGFYFPENFNYPYMASSITDFWRRWHISLSSWFRDYVYIPLGGNRCSKALWVRNIFVVWALTGIWHGANWTFLCWGLWYFLWLMAERLTGFAAKLGVLSHVYAMVVVIFGWVLFRSDNISGAIGYMAAMLGMNDSGLWDELFLYYLSNSCIVLLAALVLSLPVMPWVRKKAAGSGLGQMLEAVWVLGIFMLSLLMCISASYNPFIYFNF